MSQRQEQHQRSRLVLADPSEQIPTKSGSVRIHYEDTRFHCVDCGKSGVWTAQEQQWWYEVAKGSYYATANRCVYCRRQRRRRENPPPQYDDRLTWNDRHQIKRATRKIRGINPHIISATLADDFVTVEVRCGGVSSGNTVILKLEYPEWVVHSCEPWLFQP